MEPSASVVPHVGTLTGPAPTETMVRPSRRFVEVSPALFRMVWASVVALHGLCALFYFAIARFHWVTMNTYLASMLSKNRIGMDPLHFRTFAFVFGGVGAVHGLLIVAVMVNSIRHRRCTFAIPNTGPHAHGGSSRAAISQDTNQPHRQNLLVQVWRGLREASVALFGRTGVFGVEGKYFDTQLRLLEVFETALQSFQAYRMSEHVPRAWLNQLLVGLLVTSCVICPAVHILFEHRSLARRAVSLACDSLLDLVSSVVIPGCLIVLYLPYYDPSGEGIALKYWTDDVWLVNAQNEFLLILVTSWWDLVSRVVVSFGFIASLESSTSLIRVKSRRSSPPRKSAVVDVDYANIAALQQVHQDSSGSTKFKWLRDSVRGRRLQRVLHGLLGAWGIVILALHLYAASLPSSPVCLMQVRPWFYAKPACALLRVDCHDDVVHGYTSAEQFERYAVADDARVTRLLIRHCSELRMQPLIRSHKALTVLKFYNSTILEWTPEAALTSQHHPEVRILTLVRVQFPNGQLPDGLTDPDFPKTVNAIQFCVSNLRELPSDLNAKWPRGLYLLMEESQFESFPPVLFKLRPVQVSLARNRLTVFPFEALALDSLLILNVGGNRGISSLFPPPGTIVAPWLSIINVIDTNVSVLPSWFDGRLQGVLARTAVGMLMSYPLIAASGTPLCAHVRRIITGELHQFPEFDSFPREQMSFVMNFTHDNANDLAALTLCEILYDPIYYPLVAEDQRYRLQ